MQAKPPVLIGGVGKKRTPALAATYADEFNLPFVDTATTEAAVRPGPRRLRGDRPRPRRAWSTPTRWCCVWAPTRPSYRRRAEAIGREPDELRQNGVAGTPQEAIDKIGRYAALGSERIYLQTLDLQDLDHLRLVAADVMPHV